MSNRLIGKSLRISKSTVATYLIRAERGNVTTLAQIKSLSNNELGKLIFPEKFTDKEPVLDFEKIFVESKRKNMTFNWH